MSTTTQVQAAESMTILPAEARLRKILVGTGAALVVAPFLTWGVAFGLVGISLVAATPVIGIASIAVGILAVLTGTGRLAGVMSMRGRCLALATLAGLFGGIETLPVFFSSQVSAGLGAYLLVAADAALIYVACKAWHLTPRA
ncbi:MAG: hypothetical protein ACYCST_17050 [Acidimicrobiales bacterium]